MKIICVCSQVFILPVMLSKVDMIAFAPSYLFVMFVLWLLSLRSPAIFKERFKRGLIKRGGEGRKYLED